MKDEESIFIAARLLIDGNRRKAFLDQACGDDAQLRSNVELLLQSEQEAGSFLAHPQTDIRHAIETARLGDLDDTAQPGNRPSSGSPLPTMEPCDTPGRIGKLGIYEIIEPIGQGGMGSVLRAWDTKLHRIVAVKVMSRELTANPMAVQRFVREARSAAAVVHDHIVTIYSIEDSLQPPLLVMELIEGHTLTEKINTDETLSLPEIIRIGKEITLGLAAAHGHGLIHRDIKPGNILLSGEKQRVKITDFGLARAADDLELTQSGMILGSPKYMSPEQARGESVDSRSDLFSLGSVLYAMCTGQHAFEAETIVGAIHQICHVTPPSIREQKPEIPEWLESIIHRLLEKDRDQRFQTADEVAEILTQRESESSKSDQGLLPKIDTAAKPKSSTKKLAPVASPAKPLRQLGAKLKPRRTGIIVAIAMLGLLIITESTGLTSLSASVIRIVLGEGTLVIECNDPDVSVSIDGEVVTIGGAGIKEFRFRPGQYRLSASKNDQPVALEKELFSITRGGKQVVRISLEPPLAKQTIAKQTKKPPKVAKLSPLNFSQPVNLGRVLNTSSDDRSPFLSEDGLTLLFSSDRPGGSGGQDIWSSRRQDVSSPFGSPENIGASVNSRFSDLDPFLSADGLTLLFDSSRAGGHGAYDIWITQRLSIEDPFGPPVNLGSNVNTHSQEGSPSLSADGLTLYFSGKRGGSWQILKAERPSKDKPFEPAVLLPPSINMPSVTGDPHLSADGLTLIFNSNYPNGGHLHDLYAAFRPSTEQPFTVAQNLGSVLNSERTDKYGCLSADGRTLLFSSNRDGGQGRLDLWQATINEKDLPQPTAPISGPWQFSQPVNLGTVINSSGYDTAFLSHDQLTMYLTSNREGGSGGEDIWVARRNSIDDSFGAPKNLGPSINTKWKESGPCLSSDGLTLFFNSNRSGGEGADDIWMSQRPTVDAPWPKPRNLGSQVNSKAVDGSPSLSKDGLVLIFTSNRAGWTIWQCTRSAIDQPFEKAVKVAGGTDPWISDDGLLLLCERGNGRSRNTLQIGTRSSTRDKFENFTDLGSVNSKNRESKPFLTADGKTLYFISNRPGGFGDYDIWKADVIRRGDLEQVGLKTSKAATPLPSENDTKPHPLNPDVDFGAELNKAAKRGDWKRALEIESAHRSFNPNHHWAVRCIMGLHLLDGNEAEFKRERIELLKHHGNRYNDFNNCEQIAKACLLGAAEDQVLQHATALCDQAIEIGSKQYGDNAIGTAGLALYRSGKYNEAIERVQHLVDHASWVERSLPLAVCAMAYHQLGEPDQAAKNLAALQEGV